MLSYFAGNRASVKKYAVTAEFRKELHQAVLGAYEQALTMAQTAAPQTAAPQEEQAGPQMAGL